MHTDRLLFNIRGNGSIDRFRYIHRPEINDDSSRTFSSFVSLSDDNLGRRTDQFVVCYSVALHGHVLFSSVRLLLIRIRKDKLENTTPTVFKTFLWQSEYGNRMRYYVNMMFSSNWNESNYSDYESARVFARTREWKLNNSTSYEHSERKRKHDARGPYARQSTNSNPIDFGSLTILRQSTFVPVVHNHCLLTERLLWSVFEIFAATAP